MCLISYLLLEYYRSFYQKNQLIKLANEKIESQTGPEKSLRYMGNTIHTTSKNFIADDFLYTFFSLFTNAKSTEPS